MAARDFPHDLLAPKSRCELRCLQSAEITQLAVTRKFQADDDILGRWFRKSLISAENEFAFCIGYCVTYGTVGHDRLSAPLLIADADLTAEGSTSYVFNVIPGTLRPYIPAIALLLARDSDTEASVIDDVLAAVDAVLPTTIERPTDLNRFFDILRNRLPAESRVALSGLPAALRAFSESDLNALWRRGGLGTAPTAVALMFDSPPGFSVQRELGEIGAHGSLAETSVVRLARLLGTSDNRSDGALQLEPTNVPARQVLEVLTLSEQQRHSIASAGTRPLTVISGPPGTGKSHTISALAIDSAFAGRTVLLTSKTREAVSVVVDKLQELGGDYAVAHVGDREEQRHFAKLIRNILQYESLNIRRVKSEMEVAQDRLRLARAHAADTAHAIRKLEGYHSAFHRARAELVRLAHVPPPSVRPELDELLALRANAVWVRSALARPLLTAPQRLRTRALLHGLRSRLNLVGLRDPVQLVDAADVAFHREVSGKAALSLKAQRSIRDLWQEHDAGVKRVQDASRDLFASVRRLQITEALHADPDNTARLRRYAQALDLKGSGNTERKKTALLQEVKPALLLRCFPVWAGTSSHLSHALPLTPRLFDTVIVDEASLCDPASAMPALFRASSVVVVGDEKQLKHRTPLSTAKLSMASHRAGLSDTEIAELGFSRSLFEIASSRAHVSDSFLLDEHYRSLPPIIRFSNREYYDDHLKLMRRTPASDQARVIEFRHVGGQRNEMKVIIEEFEGALAIVLKLAGEPSPRSTGVITMTEEQAKFMNLRFAEVLPLRTIQQLRFKCGSPQSFQGDQRHTIILCPGLEPDAHPLSVQHAMDANRFNVAITRAEDRVFVVSALEPSQYYPPLRQYHELATGEARPTPVGIEDLFDSHFERQVHSELVAAGFLVEQQYESCGYRIDFVVHRGGRFVAVEADGPRHFDALGKPVPGDIDRALRLMRGGWRIERISWLEWESGPDARRNFVERIRAALNGAT